MTRPRYIAEYAAVRGLSALFLALPYRAALGLACGIAFLAHFAFRYRTGVGRARLHKVFADTLSAAARREIAWRSWRNFVFCLVDMIRLPRLSPAWIGHHVAGREDVVRTVQSIVAGRSGAILACPHMGAWELAGATLHRSGVPIFFLEGRQKNPLVDRYLRRLRRRSGVPTVQRGNNLLRGVIRKLRQGNVLAFLPDVRVPTPGPQVRFFGEPANVVGGMAVFARQAGVPIIPGFVVREGWTRHRMWVEDPVFPDPALERETDWQRMTQLVFTRIEAAVRRQPDQWFWFNKRWILDPVDPSPTAPTKGVSSH